MDVGMIVSCPECGEELDVPCRQAEGPMAIVNELMGVKGYHFAGQAKCSNDHTIMVAITVTGG